MRRSRATEPKISFVYSDQPAQNVTLDSISSSSMVQATVPVLRFNPEGMPEYSHGFADSPVMAFCRHPSRVGSPVGARAV